jgi:hypothetical protein
MPLKGSNDVWIFFRLSRREAEYETNNEEKLNLAKLYDSKRLSRKYYFRWKANIQDELIKRKRSRLFAIFSSWRMFAKQNALLKKYLREANVDEKLAYTPGSSVRALDSVRDQGSSTYRNFISNESAGNLSFDSKFSSNRLHSPNQPDTR